MKVKKCKKDKVQSFAQVFSNAKGERYRVGDVG